ncbi:hypothetical protein AVEN_29707-1 [Araneus ventricosus]|uniref:Uncharacterized protein n=1 Tax=Araneus ventricosus TaxID=182803 RepID=A0A4Y2WSL7_ARAVE|nr:hypothetical protein AVEN_29707-1 [Araneus ventricosus]
MSRDRLHEAGGRDRLRSSELDGWYVEYPPHPWGLPPILLNFQKPDSSVQIYSDRDRGKRSRNTNFAAFEENRYEIFLI